MKTYTPKARIVRTVAFNFTHFCSFWKVIIDNFYNQKNIWRAQKTAGGSPAWVPPRLALLLLLLASAPSALDSAPGKGCPSPLPGTMKIMVFSTAMSRATSRMSFGLTSILAWGSRVCEGPTALGKLHRVGLWGQASSCPTLLQGHTACGHSPCNSLASSAAPGYELIRPRQGSKSTRRERREKSAILT